MSGREVGSLPAALASALVGLLGRARHRPRAWVPESNQGLEPAAADPVVAAAGGMPGHDGIPVTIERHLPRRGPAEHRHQRLGRVRARLMGAPRTFSSTTPQREADAPHLIAV
ncbi:MAG: hypothetical protein R2761_19075 [Acidimicrobiales bacterium]